MSSMVKVKTTVEIQDNLLLRAKRLAKNTGRPLRSIVEDGLRRALASAEQPKSYRLPDLSVGDPNKSDPLELLTWQDLRAEIYGEPKSS